jgi:CHASE2 domain-containing sensor protein
MLGTLLHGRYKIIRVLGTGGFGQTFLAEDTYQPGSPKCVVKQLKPASQDVKFLQIARRLFKTEADILDKVGIHPQIPSLLSHFEEEDEFYLVQEFIEGKTLSDELATTKRLAEAQVIELLRDVLQVLAFVHSNQVIHRDIKPSNLIRRQSDSRLVLIDFGAVKEIQTQLTIEPDQTGHTVGIGTQGYVPSEQLMGKPRFSSDIYALGMTAIQALTGSHPSQMPTHPDTAEIIWQDQARVSPWFAAIINRMVRYHFSQRYQSATEVIRALDRESDPLNDPTTVSPTEVLGNIDTRLYDTNVRPVAWKKLTRRGLKAVAIASLSVTSFVLGVRQLLVLDPLRLTFFEPLEVAVLDQMMQLQPDPGPDPRLLVVEITEADLQAQKRYPLSDQTFAQVLERLNRYQPRVIGLDIYRDLPQQPGRAELLAQLQKPNVIAITKIGNPDDVNDVGVPPPHKIDEQIGFNDLVTDHDTVVRRNLIMADFREKTLFSFGLRLALAYLKPEGITAQGSPANAEILRLGNRDFIPLEENSGGYQALDANGYQVLLNYRSARNVARQVTLTQVLNNEIEPEWVKDKVVLVGTTAPSLKDLFTTPFSSREEEYPRMAGVILHAQMVSQLLSVAIDDQPLLWYWSEPIEMLWIALWAVLAGLLAWCIRHPLFLSLAELGLFLALLAICFGIFTQRGWVPVVAPAVAAFLTTGVVVSSRTIYPEVSDRLRLA